MRSDDTVESPVRERQMFGSTTDEGNVPACTRESFLRNDQPAQSNVGTNQRVKSLLGGEEKPPCPASNLEASLSTPVTSHMRVDCFQTGLAPVFPAECKANIAFRCRMGNIWRDLPVEPYKGLKGKPL